MKREKIVATVKKALKRKKSFKSLSRDIDKISNKLRLENVADNEDLASREWIKNVSSKKATFSVSFLKFRIVLFILQQSDSFAQRVRSFVEKTSMKHDKKNENVERHDSIKRDDVESNIIRKKVDLDFSFKWNIENDLLRWKNKWYVLSNLLKRKFLKQNHDDSYADHFEHKRTLNLLKRKYFWNNMSKNVKKYVDSCSICHRVKLVKHKSHDLLQALSISKSSRQDWTMNFITNLSSSKHRDIVYDSILMIIDRYTKFSLYISSKKTWNAENLTNALIDEIFIKFERFVFIVTNRESLFIFKFWSFLCYHLWIRLRYNIVYHSQTNEQIEKQNQIFESYLKSYVNYQQNDWIKWFSIAEYAYNNNLNSVLKQISFQMMFDSEVKFENVIQKDLKIDIFATRDRVVQLSNVKRVCETRWKQALNKTKRNYNKKKIQIEFKINDKIFLNARNIISIRSFKKLNYKYYDFYTINESISKISYKLNFSSIMRNIHDVFHVFLLKLANEKDDETSSLIWIKDEKQWKIEEIVDKRVKKNKTSYLVKWFEYSHSNNEWVKEENMSNVKKAIEKFLKFSTKNDKCVNRRRWWDEELSMHSFQTFFSRDFLSLILTRHRKNKKKMFNFSIYLKNYLLLRDRTKRRFLDENEDLHLKLLACNDLLDESIILLLFLLFLFFFLFFLFFLFSSRFSSSSSSSFFLSSRENSSSARSSSEYDSRHRRAFFFWRKSEDRSWCRSESVWKNESKHHKHFHQYLASSIAQRRRSTKLIFVDKRSKWHLRFIAQYSRKSRWSWRDEKTVFEWRKYFSSSRVVLFFVASWVFSERKSFEFTSRDEHLSRRNQSRWTSEWEFYSSQHKKSNQSEIDQLKKSDRQIYDKRTTR